MLTLSPVIRSHSIFKTFSCRSGINFYSTTHNAKHSRNIVLYSAPPVQMQLRISFPFYICRYMAGHAKWQNIKFIKSEKDKLKGALCNKYVRLVTASVRESGPDPKANIKLAHILEEARKNNIPSSTLDNALKRATSKKLQSGFIEMLGPGGSIIIFEYETDNLGEMRRMLKVICRKYSVGIFPGSSERWRAAYEKKGIIRVSKQLNGQDIDSEKMLDDAIEAGAEDVKKGEEDNIYEFYSAPEDIHLVKKELEQKFVIEEAFVGYLTTSTVSIPEPDKTHAMNFLNELGDLPDTTRLYENIE